MKIEFIQDAGQKEPIIRVIAAEQNDDVENLLNELEFA